MKKVPEVIGRQKTDGDDYYDDGYDYAAAAYSSGNEMLESEVMRKMSHSHRHHHSRVSPTLPPKPRLLGSGNSGNLSASPPQGVLSLFFSSFSYCFAPMAFLFLLLFL